MHCHHSAIFHSKLPTAYRPLNADPATHYHLGNQPLDVIMRDLTSFILSSSCDTQRIQYRKNDREGDSDSSQENTISKIMASKRSKTNSERGHAFRARRKKFEDDLVAIVNSLRQEVADLMVLRGVHAEKTLCSRNTMGGSLVRLVREYFVLFEHGIPSIRGVGQKRPTLLMDESSMSSINDRFAAKQEAFLKSAMESEMQFGQVTGPAMLLEQWKRYTNYHSRIHVEVVSIKVSGEENDPIVTVYSDLRVVFSRATFDHVFPHVADNEELVNRFIGRAVVYHGVNHFHFSSKGQISVYESSVGFVDSLVQSGASISDIALLMQQAQIADECRLGENNNNSASVQELEQENTDKIMFPNDNISHGASERISDADSNSDNIESSESKTEEVSTQDTSGRLAIEFLLS